MSNKFKTDIDTEWLDKALECYEKEKSQNPDYLSFDNAYDKSLCPPYRGTNKRANETQQRAMRLAVEGDF